MKTRSAFSPVLFLVGIFSLGAAEVANAADACSFDGKTCTAGSHPPVEKSSQKACTDYCASANSHKACKIVKANVLSKSATVQLEGWAGLKGGAYNCTGRQNFNGMNFTYIYNCESFQFVWWSDDDGEGDSFVRKSGEQDLPCR